MTSQVKPPFPFRSSRKGESGCSVSLRLRYRAREHRTCALSTSNTLLPDKDWQLTAEGKRTPLAVWVTTLLAVRHRL